MTAVFVISTSIILVCSLPSFATAQHNNNASLTPTAHLTVANYPLPPSWSTVSTGTIWQCGRPAITKRVAVEEAAYKAFNDTLSPQGLALRYVNFTLHPSVEVDLDFMACTEYGFQMWAANPTSLAPLETATALSQATFDAQERFAQEYGTFIRFMWTSRQQTASNTTATDTLDILSNVQITGPRVFPFTVDKQAVLLTALFDCARSGLLPIATANVSDWRAAAAAPNEALRERHGRRRSLQGSQTAAEDATVSTDIWMSLVPARNITAQQAWQTIAASVQNFTAVVVIAMSVRLRNATVLSRPAGKATALVSYERPDSGIPIDSSTAAGGGFPPVAVAVIVIAAVAALVAIAVVAVRRRCRRQRHCKEGKGSGCCDSELNASPGLEQLMTSSTPRNALPPIQALCATAGGIAISPAEVKICRRSDGRPWLLGCGNYGSVYKGHWRSLHEVAVKQLNCPVDDMSLTPLHEELGILKKVSCHRNIVQLFGITSGSGEVTDELGRLEEGPMLVMEYMERGDLRHALCKQPAVYRWTGRGAYIALDIAHGMHFLHCSGVIHRDIKASNVLLTRDGTAKIADVGLATMATCFTAGSATGTFSHAAPELLMGRKCSPKVDVYSFGVVLWEIVTGQHPVRGHLREVHAGECPPEVESLLEDCINVDVESRPTSAEIVERLATLIKRQQVGLDAASVA